MRCINPIHQHVQLAVVFGKPAAQLFADDDVRQMRDLKCAVDRVVIGEVTKSIPRRWACS